jgi:hypothetical protein
LSKKDSVETVTFYCFSEFDFNVFNDLLGKFYTSKKI